MSDLRINNYCRFLVFYILQKVDIELLHKLFGYFADYIFLMKILCLSGVI